ncbi:MAG: squalene/phytoene synthase family protein, partial [Burkholderiaceae bacterium]
MVERKQRAAAQPPPHQRAVRIRAKTSTRYFTACHSRCVRFQGGEPSGAKPSRTAGRAALSATMAGAISRRHVTALSSNFLKVPMAVDHYENFPVASLLLPARLRPAVQSIYAFARSADDLADEGDALPDERLAALGAYDAALTRIARDEPAQTPMLRALEAT